MGVVALRTRNVRPRGPPVGPDLGEVHLRTSVEGPDGTRGVYFFNLDAGDALTVASLRRRLPRAVAAYAAELDGFATDFFAVNGLDRPTGEPLVHYPPGVGVTADRVRRADLD